MGAVTIWRVADEEAEAALAVLRAWLDAIKAMPSNREQETAIRDLHNHLRELFDEATEIRTAVMFRIYDEEKLSLAPLADRVGMSKQGAQQKIKQRERDRKKEKRDG
jgi:hypothetical protein